MKLLTLLTQCQRCGTRLLPGTLLVRGTQSSSSPVPLSISFSALRLLSSASRFSVSTPNPNPALNKKPDFNFVKSKRKPTSDGLGGGAAFLLIIPLSAFALGTWQVFRWRWKLGQIAALESKVYAPPIDLLENLGSLDDLEYSRVKVKGKFDYSSEVLIGPRSLNRDGPSTPKQGIIKKVKNDTGYYLVTPFQVAGTDLRILVNRGWIPSRKETNFKSVSDSEQVEIIGVVRKAEARPQFVNTKSSNLNFHLYRNVPKIAEHLSTAEIFLDLNEIVGKDCSESFPIPAQTRVTLRNEHVQYFFTWFSLSAITGYMWHRRFILKKALK